MSPIKALRVAAEVLPEPERGPLEAAIELEKSAARCRTQGLSTAADAYDMAGEAYADTGLAFHARGESELARLVRSAIDRCRHIRDNILHPREHARTPATTPRPCCLNCGKPLRRYKRDGVLFYGKVAEWGDYGDNLWCGQTCTQQWARWAVGSGAVPRKRRAP